MFIAILGRQPAISIAELERVHKKVEWFSSHTALVHTDSVALTSLGGTLKAGKVIIDIPKASWQTVNTKIIQHYTAKWQNQQGKQTLGISVYGTSVNPRDIQKTGLIIKKQLRDKGVALRLIPNESAELSTATSHHNKLGLSNNKTELLVVFSKTGRVVVAESVGAQNITALAKRDQGRPKRDAFVGMLPPKLAQIMLNLALGNRRGSPTAVLDPFCGTGVLLQEALLMGYSVYGSDLNPKMIDYTKINLQWFQKNNRHLGSIKTIREGDATTFSWSEASSLDAVVCETYLGQPFSAPPSPSKLAEVKRTCNAIITAFLKNIGSQIPSGTPLCLAVPAWRDKNGEFSHLPLTKSLNTLGYDVEQLTSVKPHQLLYFREDQVVTRELLVIKKR